MTFDTPWWFLISRCNPVGVQSHADSIPCGFNSAWVQFCVGSILCGFNSGGSIPCRFNPVRCNPVRVKFRWFNPVGFNSVWVQFRGYRVAQFLTGCLKTWRKGTNREFLKPVIRTSFLWTPWSLGIPIVNSRIPFKVFEPLKYLQYPPREPQSRPWVPELATPFGATLWKRLYPPLYVSF